MGRPESPLDPADGPLAMFAWELRQLRARAGMPTYRQLARKAGYSASALSLAASGKEPPSLELTLAFAGACGGDMSAWRERWQRLDAELPHVASASSPHGHADRSMAPADPAAPVVAACQPLDEPDDAGGAADTGNGHDQAGPVVGPARADAVESAAGQPARHGRLGLVHPIAWFLAGGTLAVTTTLSIVALTIAMSMMMTRSTASGPLRYPARSVSALPGSPAASSSARPRPTAPAVAPSTKAPREKAGSSPSAPVLVVAPTPGTSSTTAPAPRTSGPTHSPSPIRRRQPTQFAALAGYGCPSGRSYGTSAGSGWIRDSSGGLTSSGCTGAFATHWITGSAVSCCSSSYSTFTWWFRPGLARARCAVAVYIPSGDDAAVAGHPARYTVETRSGQAGTFSLDQVDNMGQWLRAPFSFPERGGKFSVVLNNAAHGSHQVAASAVRVTCHA